MRNKIVLAALFLTTPADAQMHQGCVVYGSESDQRMWQLCPGGKKYEREYRYWGIWSGYYEIRTEYGACDWKSPHWICNDAKFVCTNRECRKEK